MTGCTALHMTFCMYCCRAYPRNRQQQGILLQAMLLCCLLHCWQLYDKLYARKRRFNLVLLLLVHVA
jgi:hypothetical protein